MIAWPMQPKSQTQHAQDPFPPSASLISSSISCMALTTYSITQAKNLNSFQTSLKYFSNLSALVQASSLLSKTIAAVSYLPVSKNLSSLHIFIFTATEVIFLITDHAYHTEINDGSPQC